MTAVLIVVVAFAAMELVSYLTHRYVMHGFAIGWHRSHHAPADGPLERNDLFPVCFSIVGFVLFLLATTGPRIGPLFPVAIGVTLYGALYLFVHEIYIHRRASIALPHFRYLAWLRESHWHHHGFGGEPYGMLLPIVSRSLRARRGRAEVQSLDRSGRDIAERSSSRSTRPRL